MMGFAALSLMLGLVISPVTALWGLVNCIVYRRDPRAITLSVFAIIVAAGAFMFEMWRMGGEWD